VSTTLSSTTPVARKAHQCNYCLEEIPKGEQYSRWTGIHDMDFQSSAMHIECAKAFSDSGWDEYYPGEHMRGTSCDNGCTRELHGQQRALA